MPAYLKKIDPGKCADYCGANATYEVYNTYNALMGYFCARHANKRVKEMNAILERDGQEST